MEVILLERVAKLGQMGEVVKVRDGYARNFLLKRKKALRATAENRAKYDGMKAELEANNIQAKGEAAKVAEKIEGRDIVIIRQASESGQLFGSVTVRDIVDALAADGVTVSRPQVWLDAPIKAIGKQKVSIAVHPELEAIITVTVARSADEAERIKRGEDISTRQEDQDAAAEAIAAAGEFFDPEAQHDEVQPAAAEEKAEKKASLPVTQGPAASSGRALDSRGRLLVEHRDRGQRGCGVLLHASGDAEHVGRNDGNLAPRLDHARAADQTLPDRRRQQVQLVLGRQRRLAARSCGRDRGRVVDEEGSSPPMEQPLLLQ